MKRYIPRILATVAAALVFLLSFGIASAATGVATGDTEPGLYELAKPVVEAIFNSDPGLAAALALVLVAGATNRYAGKRWPIFNTGAARALTVLVGSFGGAAAAAITGGASWSLTLAWNSLKIAAGAAGVYSLLKSLLLPVVKSLRGKLPSWLRPVFDFVIAVFEKPNPIAEAQAAGDAAVAASPSAGIAGVVGVPVAVDNERSGPVLLPRAESAAASAPVADAMATELK